MGAEATKVLPASVNVPSKWKQLPYNPHWPHEETRPERRVLVYSNVMNSSTRGLSSTFIYKANGIDRPPIYGSSHFHPHQFVDFQEETTIHRIDLCVSDLSARETNDGAILLVTGLDEGAVQSTLEPMQACSFGGGGNVAAFRSDDIRGANNSFACSGSAKRGDVDGWR